MMSLFDLPFLTASLLFLIIVIPLLYFVFNNLFSALAQTGHFEWLPSMDFARILINAIPFLIIGFGFGSILLAFLIPTHPIFLPFAIIFALFCLFFNLVAMELITQFVQNFPFLSDFPIVTWFLQRFGIIFFIITIGIISVMYLVRR